MNATPYDAVQTTDNGQRIAAVGQLVTFSKGSGGLWASPDQLRAALTAAGFDGLAAKVAELDPVLRAKESALYRAGWQVTTPCKIEVVDSPKGGSAVTFGILFKEKVGGRVDWLQRETVTYQKEGGWSAPTTPSGQEFVRVSSETWQRFYNYGHIRDLVIEILRNDGAIPIGNGGIYFTCDRGLVERLRALVKELRGCQPQLNTAHLRTIDVGAADEEGIEAMAEAAIEQIGEHVTAFRERLDEWRAKAKGRSSTLENMLGELALERQRAQAYSLALRFSASALDAQLEEVANEVAGLLDQRLQPLREALAQTAPAAPVVSEAPAPVVSEAPAPVVSEAPAPVVSEAPAPAAPASEIPSVDELGHLSEVAIHKLCKEHGIASRRLGSRAERITALLNVRAAQLG